jgi:hypothetical protein
VAADWPDAKWNQDEKVPAAADLWVNGLLRTAGETIHMIQAEAKYLKHALEEVLANASPAAAPAAEKVSPHAPVLGASVEEQPVSQGKRRRQ